MEREQGSPEEAQDARPARSCEEPVGKGSSSRGPGCHRFGESWEGTSRRLKE